PALASKRDACNQSRSTGLSSSFHLRSLATLLPKPYTIPKYSIMAHPYNVSTHFQPTPQSHGLSSGPCARDIPLQLTYSPFGGVSLLAHLSGTSDRAPSLLLSLMQSYAHATPVPTRGTSSSHPLLCFTPSAKEDVSTLSRWLWRIGWRPWIGTPSLSTKPIRLK